MVTDQIDTCITHGTVFWDTLHIYIQFTSCFVKSLFINYIHNPGFFTCCNGSQCQFLRIYKYILMPRVPDDLYISTQD